MIIDKNNISDEDKILAVRIMNEIRSGKRCIGNPAEGLKKTLSDLEKKAENTNSSETDFELVDKSLSSDIALVKAGINGEEQFSDYVTKLLKHCQKELNGIIFLSSLTIDNGSNNLDYIPDTDFLAVYGNNIMVIDAKNIRTDKSVPIFLSKDNEICSPRGVLLELRPSTYLWRSFLQKKGIEYNLIEGYACIVNKTGATIFRNMDWYNSENKLIHISQLKEILLDWKERIDKIEGEPKLSLRLLTELVKTQIRKNKPENKDLEDFRLKFGV